MGVPYVVGIASHAAGGAMGRHAAIVTQQASADNGAGAPSASKYGRILSNFPLFQLVKKFGVGDLRGRRNSVLRPHLRDIAA